MARGRALRLETLVPSSASVRALALSTLTRTIGRGLFITASVIYFTRSVGLSAPQVGLGLTIAALIGLVAGVPGGHLADIRGARGVTMTASALVGVIVGGYALVHGFWGFLAIASTICVLESVENAARAALIGGVVPTEVRVKTRAYLRAVTNVGWSIGAIFAGVALHVGTRAAYLALVYGCAVAYVVGALLLLRVPRVPPSRTHGDGPTWIALRDKPFAAVTALNAVLAIHNGMLTVAVPLWVIERTRAPALIVSVLALINTITVVLLQVRMSRGTEDVVGGARALARSGLFLFAACVLYAVASGTPAWLAVSVLVLGAFVHVLGELRQAAGGWALSYELAPPHAQGQYLGLFGMGASLSDVIAPALLTTAVIGWGFFGWLLFGAVFAAAGLSVPAVADWAVRTRRVAAEVPVTVAS